MVGRQILKLFLHSLYKYNFFATSMCGLSSSTSSRGSKVRERTILYLHTSPYSRRLLLYIPKLEIKIIKGNFWAVVAWVQNFAREN